MEAAQPSFYGCCYDNIQVCFFFAVNLYLCKKRSISSLESGGFFSVFLKYFRKKQANTGIKRRRVGVRLNDLLCLGKALHLNITHTTNVLLHLSKNKALP